MVTIAIIAILAAILFPVFARARENARKASCLSNLKQIGLAVMMYSQDYDETYPVGRFDTSPLTWWFNVIDPYIKNKQVFICPTAGQVGGANSSKGYGWNTQGLGNSSTTYNGFGYYQGKWCTPTNNGPLKMAEVEEAATSILITDPSSNNNTSSGGYYAIGYYGKGYIPVLHGGQVGPFYDTNITSGSAPVAAGGGGNYLFADGHAKYLEASRSLCSNMWNVDKERGKIPTSHCPVVHD